MQYMIIERFHEGRVVELYQRFAEKGRMLPAGVRYINSWIDETVSICYQLMEAHSIDKIIEWTQQWEDLADFHIVPVISSAAASEKVFSSPISK